MIKVFLTGPENPDSSFKNDLQAWSNMHFLGVYGKQSFELSVSIANFTNDVLMYCGIWDEHGMQVLDPTTGTFRFLSGSWRRQSSFDSFYINIYDD